VARQKETASKIALRFVLVFIWLYIFLLAVTLLGTSFQLFGKGFAEGLLQYASNPIAGLFIGILATSIVQSSSTVTSTVVAMVAASSITAPDETTRLLEAAVPIVMGANIGTSVTSIIVAMGFVQRRLEFGRAISGATVHDFFNVLVTLILFPIEVFFHPLLHAAQWLATSFSGVGDAEQGIAFTSPVKAVVGPGAHAIVELLREVLGFGNVLTGILVLILSGFLLFFALVRLTKTIKKLLMGKLAIVFNKTLKRGGLTGIAVGAVATGIVQSSSVTTSLLVPLVAAGLIDVAQAFPLTLGANIGTTVTAVLAALTGNVAGLVIAFMHVLFNIVGVVMIYPVAPLRKIPIALALKLGDKARRSRKFAVIYVILAFFVLPIAVILISQLF
jgi:sodium-dependent phosphate cotransporter